MGRKLAIKGKDNGQKTRVIDVQTGDVIEGVQSINLGRYQLSFESDSRIIWLRDYSNVLGEYRGEMVASTSFEVLMKDMLSKVFMEEL